MFNEYPYVNLQDVNLDWILKHIKDLETNLQDFIKLNTIKYADPIIWNITSQYEANTVVIDGNTGTAYLSVQPVPSGVALTNIDYWSSIFTLDLLSANQNITFRDDGTNVVATFASDAGDWILWNFNLYKVTQEIPVNTAYIEGFNLERYTVELFINDYITNILNIIGDLDDLNTTDKTSIVNAINELEDRPTGRKWEVITDYGAVSGGTAAENTAALLATIATGKSVYIPQGEFLIDDDTTFELNSNTDLYCNGVIKFTENRLNPVFKATEKENINIRLNTYCQITPENTYLDNMMVLLLRGAKNIVVENSIIDGCRGDGIYIGRNYDNEEFNQCTNVTVRNNLVKNCKRNSIAMPTGENIVIDGNRIESPVSNNWNISCCIDIEPNNTQEIVKNLQIINNYIDATSNVNKSLIRFNIGSTKRPRIYENVKVNGNTLYCHNTPEIAIYIDGRGTDCNLTDLEVSHNAIFNACQESLRIIGAKDVKIEKNFIENDSVGMVLSYGLCEYMINGNNIGISGTRAIYVRNNNGAGVIIENNIINGTNSSEAIFVDGNSNATTNVIVNKNIVNSVGTTSLRLFNTTDSICSFNLLTGNLTDTHTTNNNKLLNKISGVFVP